MLNPLFWWRDYRRGRCFCTLSLSFSIESDVLKKTSLRSPDLTLPSASVLVPPQAMFRREPRATSSLESEAIEQTMERLPQGVRRLAAQLRTPLSIEELWTVLTDYENLSNFIPNLSSSQLVHREGHTVRLQQVGSQQLLGLRFSAQVQLELTEVRAEGLLSFKMVKGDFRRFEGAWRVNELADGCSLVYELTVQGCIGMPIALIEERLRDDLSSNLQAVMMEAKRRRD